MGRFIYTKYREILYVEHWEYLFTENTGKYFMYFPVFCANKYSQCST
jgi:hypothetical protein